MSEDGPLITWDTGTAYDFFVSLLVLHDPGRYGLRGAWAAGVRSRLPAAERAFLEEAMAAFLPLGWIYTLPEPADSAVALATLAAIPPAERLAALTFATPAVPPEMETVLREVATRGSWTEADRRVLTGLPTQEEHMPKTKKQFGRLLDLWATAAQSGELYLRALRAYRDSFFAREEERIQPHLEAAAASGQEMAARMSLPSLLEELSQGLRFEALPALQELVLVPSFWSTPLVAGQWVEAGRRLFLFGARPATVSLVPGELVPDDLTRALKAVADPTRLRILHYLAQEPLTPTRLAERLRLRPPTVVHHLHKLRLARLVRLTVAAEGGKRYTVRPGAVAQTCAALQAFIEGDEGGAADLTAWITDEQSHPRLSQRSPEKSEQG